MGDAYANGDEGRSRPTHGGRLLRTAFALTVAGGALATQWPALAQQAVQPAQDAASRAKPASGTTAGAVVDLDTITVTATKTAQSTVDVLGGASSVTRQDVERLRPSSIADLVRNLPGVTA